MGNYVQWSAARKLGRVVWVYGSEETLRIEVAEYVRSQVKASDLDRYIFDAATDDEDSIWEALYGKSLSDSSTRLVEVYNADRLSKMDKLTEWLHTYAKYSTETTMLLLSEDDPSVALKPPKCTLIKCVMPKAEDKLKWTMRSGGLSEASARRLIEYKNGQLSGIKDICHKIRRLLPDIEGIELTPETLESLDEETPYSLVEAVLERNKKDAFLAISNLPSDGIGRVLSSLDYNIGLIEKLKDSLAALPRGAKMEPIPGFPMARVTELAPLARVYSFIELTRCRQILVMMEASHRQGITEGLLEALVTLW